MALESSLSERGHRAMSDSTPSFSVVRITFDPYSHDQVQELVRKVQREFGRDKSRWYYMSADIDDVEKNVWVLDFKFRDPYDATIFGLKYSR